MALRIACPSCKAACVIDDAQRGTAVVCANCQKPMRIPPAQAAPAKTDSAAKSTSSKAIDMIGGKPPSASPPKSSVQPGVPLKTTPVEKEKTNTVRGARKIPTWVLIGGGVALFGFLVIGSVTFAAVFWYLSKRGPDKNSAAIVAQGTAEAEKPVAVVPPDPPKVEEVPEKVAEPKAPPVVTPASKSKEKRAGSNDKPSTPSGGGQLSREVLTRVKESTVHIRVTLADGGTAQGSGFFAIEPGLVLTNAHVVGMLYPETSAPKNVEIIYKSGEPDTRKFTANVLGVDRSSDLAILRITGSDLPEPLEVKTTSDLIETQTVYVVGFPLGDYLGKNITVSQSSVSALRKGPGGEVVKVQVNGGMHPGNSGGPVVNTSGDVIGVAVSGIDGTQLNFAVPGEYVHHVSNGSVAAVANGTTVRDQGKLKMRVDLDVLDPLGRVKGVGCDWWIASAGKPRSAAEKQPQPLAGDTPHERLAMVYKSGAGHADIILPAKIPPGHVIWVQPVVVNGAGKLRWEAPVTFTPTPPVDRLPALLAIKHYWGARPVSLSMSNMLRFSDAVGADRDLTLTLNATFTETMMGQKDGTADLRMRYRKYDLRLPQDMETPVAKREIKGLTAEFDKVHVDLAYDSKNTIKKNKVDLSKVKQQASKNDLKDVHKDIQEVLEMLTVSLPGKKVQPGEKWTAKRPLFLFSNLRGNAGAAMEVTYMLEGVRQYEGHEEAVITFAGVVKDRRVGALSVSGRVNGTAYLDLMAYQISSAGVKAKLVMGDNTGKSANVLVDCKLERKLGKELLHVRDKLTEDDPLDAKNRPFKVHNVQLEAGKPCVISLESPKGQGMFDTYLRLEDSDGAILAEDDDGGVDLNSLITFTPATSGTYRVVVTCFQPATGNYLLIARQ